ncbi:MAG TPA: hypothetical protein VGX16_03720, partial [Solirubrobacteraceae bacterium]|nr:hypothetical protein [Solirubrobacteraceae bacterium]
ILASVAAQFTSHLSYSRYQAPMEALTNGYRLAYLIGAAFAGCAAVVTFRLIPARAAQAAGQARADAQGQGQARAAGAPAR